MKKLISLVLALAMIMMVGAAFAQTEAYTGTDGDGAKITISNAAKGETYTVVKLFDATLAESSDSTSIAYQGEIPDTMTDIFQKNATTGEITYKGTGDELTSDEAAILKTWAEKQTPTASATSDGSKLEFTGLPYGYYIVLTTQGAGAVTVNSTHPNASLKDKNTTTITANKEVGKNSYSIGDTITYTATFGTTNYYGSGDDAKVVTKYDIEDTLPEFLSNVQITSVVVKKGDTVLATLTDNYTEDDFGDDKKITIDWADKDATTGEWTSKYTNGAQIIITYTAVLTSVTNINTADTNTVSIHPHVGDNDETPWEDTWQKDKEIKTYGVALHKVDENGYGLDGATFTVKGLTVTDGDAEGEYIVSSYSPDADAAQSAELSTNDDGYLYIVGLASDVSLTVTEVKAPDGYNKLNAPVTGVTPQLMTTAIYTESGSIKYDAKGNVIASEAAASKTETVEKNLTDLNAKAVPIVNLQGTELPSTGGIGTTLFYVLGGLLVIGAAVILVARRKAQD